MFFECLCDLFLLILMLTLFIYLFIHIKNIKINKLSNGFYFSLKTNSLKKKFMHVFEYPKK